MTFIWNKATNTIKQDYDPQPKQQLLHNANVTQILYGGAVGGGKSYGLRQDAYKFCIENPNLRAYLFRSTRPDLYRNHIDFIPQEIPPQLGRFNSGENTLEFTNGSKIYFSYCEREADLSRYQGAEMHWLGIDEATHFTPKMLSFLRTRVRLGGFSKQVKQPEFLPRIIFATNPQGGPGHSFIKRTFIDVAPPMTVFHDKSTAYKKSKRRPKNFPGYTSIYIPARMDDNKYLDEDYEGSLMSLEPSLMKALRDGDWDTVVGAAVHNLTRNKHMVQKFTPPKHWTHVMSLDWGTARPFSVGWYAICDGGALFKARGDRPEIYVPDGAIIRYHEYYGWNGRDNEGCRMDSNAVAKKIKEIEKEMNMPTIDYRVADSQCWAQTDGPSVQEKMRNNNVDLRQAKKDRKACYEEIISRLSGNPQFMDSGEMEDHPMLFVSENCKNFWRTVPSLTLDESDPDKGPGAVPSQEDHIYDELVYMLRSRPFVSTEQDRWFQEFGEEYRKARKTNNDPYSTGRR